ERDGKSGDSRATTWSTFRLVIRYVAVIVLTRPTLGNAATTVPPFKSTSLIVRSSTSAKKPPRPRREVRTKYVCESDPPRAESATSGRTPAFRSRQRLRSPLYIFAAS